MKPEGGVDQVLNVGTGGVHPRQAPGPVGAGTVELGQIRSRESSAEAPAKTVPYRLDHFEGDLAPTGIFEPPQMIGAGFPAEECVVERVGAFHPDDVGSFTLPVGSGRSPTGDLETAVG